MSATSSAHTHACSCSPGSSKTHYFQYSFAIRFVTFTTISTKTCHYTQWLRRQQEDLSWRKQYTSKQGDYSLSWQIYKNLYFFESTVHHCRNTTDADCSSVGLQLQVLSSPVKTCMHSMTRIFTEGRLDFPMWLKTCLCSNSYLACLHKNITSACRKRSEHEGMSRRRLVGPLLSMFA